MELFDFEKHMDEFKSGKIVVNCEEKEDAEEFSKELHDRGFSWISRSSLLKNCYWEDYGKKTCYSYCDKKSVTHGSVNWHTRYLQQKSYIYKRKGNKKCVEFFKKIEEAFGTSKKIKSIKFDELKIEIEFVERCKCIKKEGVTTCDKCKKPI